jgi:hypothetical protein
MIFSSTAMLFLPRHFSLEEPGYPCYELWCVQSGFRAEPFSTEADGIDSFIVVRIHQTRKSKSVQTQSLLEFVVTGSVQNFGNVSHNKKPKFLSHN